MLKPLLLFALIFAVARLQAPTPSPYPYAIEDHIINLGEPTWDHAQEEFPEGLIVYFYEPYCLACRQFWPELKEAAASLATGSDKSRVRIAKVECHDEVKLCEAKGVTNYPTILLYRRDGQTEKGTYPYEYRGPRTAEDFEKWVRKVVDGKYETISNRETLFSRYSTALLLNRGSEEISQAYKDLIDDVEIARADGDLKSDTGDIGAIVTQDGTKLKISGSANAIIDNVYEILYTKRNAVPTFGYRQSQKLQGPDNANFVLLFRTDKFKYDSEAAKAFDKVSKESDPNDLQFAYVNVANDILGSTMARLFGVKNDSAVTVGIASKEGKVIKKYKLADGQVSESAIKGLIGDMGKKEKRYYMSAPAPADAPKGGSGTIAELVGSNYKSVVDNKDLNVLVMFYFPWCEWCVKLEPTWKALAYRYRSVDNVVIARFDVSQNDAEGFDLSEFPVIVFYEAKQGAQYQEYLSERTMTKFRQFLESKIPRLSEIEL